MSQYHPILFFLQLGVLVSLGLAGYCAYRLRRHGRSLVVLSVGLLAVSIAIYNGAAAMKTASLALSDKLWWYKLEFLGSGAVPSVAVTLALAYVGQERWLTRPVLAVLVGIPAVAVPLIIANPGSVMITEPTLVETGGFWALEHGYPPLFVMAAAWGEGATLLAALVVGGGGLFGNARRIPALILGAALGLPYGALMLKTLQVYPPGGEGINIAPVFETASLALVALAIARYRLFDLLPVGRSKAFGVMDDGYVLADATGTIVDANEAARTLLGEERLTARPVEAVVPGLGEPGGTGDRGTEDSVGTSSSVGTSEPAGTDEMETDDIETDDVETDDIVETGGREEAKAQEKAKSQEAAGPITATVEGRTLQMRSSAVRDGTKAVGRVFMLRDITPLREREQALAEQAEQLRELDEAKSRFFANISHELRTPLTLIRGPVRHVHGSLGDMYPRDRSSKSRRGRPEDAEQDLEQNVKRLEIVDRNAARLQRLVDQLLGIARLEAGAYDLAARQVDPVAEVRRIADAFQPLADRKDLALALSAEASCPAGADPLCVDPEALEHVMSNLFSNAIKFTPGGGRVHADVREQAGAVVITVCDTGPGIPESELGAVFERFGQAGTRPPEQTATGQDTAGQDNAGQDNAGQDAPRRGGTGIGLAFARELVDLHGGTITADSSEGEGTTFTVRFPRGRDHLSDEQLADGSPGEPPEEHGLAPEGPVLFSELDGFEAEAFKAEAFKAEAFKTEDLEPDGSGSYGSGEAPLYEAPLYEAPLYEAPLQEDRSRQSQSPGGSDGPGGHSEPGSHGEPGGRGELAKRVLIVDDSADMRQHVTSVLAPTFDVLEAAGGEEGVEMAREYLPDVILADVMMPGLSGYEMTRRLKEAQETEAIPVIMLTARASTEGEIAGLQAGADDYVTKPFDADVLRQRVKGVVAHQKRLRRRLRLELESGTSAPKSPSAESSIDPSTDPSADGAGRPDTNPSTQPDTQPNSQTDVEQEARAAAREHLSDPSFGASDLASTIGTSRSTLYRRLQKKAGISPSALIAEVRMEQARRLLKRGEAATQVAYAVGYKRLSSFSRAFERHAGQPPSTVAAE
ncbi:histidine kinase N-terminal 7TM domain-containing protein [Salinibacter ruber]|uniref:histidine kinase N-terminal 7TM domain-containing protein n=1 Tax=Salinibacter ruber TaxID=146919 RepID=UPI00216A1969|nr:histidine kinase N-terminal 7TM domain-containing protein [Salinibacter ruber]MCS4198524.1 signal transduction histidine kinase/DNA-binding NarL/FixJ family response regulator/AraC-like DNA-binding protein [Salinibacter ruber]